MRGTGVRLGAVSIAEGSLRGAAKRRAPAAHAVLLCAAVVFAAIPVGAADADREARIAARKELAAIGVPFSTEALLHAIRENDGIGFELLVAAGVDIDGARNGTTALLTAIG